MTDTKEKKQEMPPIKKGDVLAMPGSGYCVVTGGGSHSSTLHTSQWIYPVRFYDGSKATVMISKQARVILHPEEELIVVSAPSSKQVMPISLKEYVKIGMGLFLKEGEGIRAEDSEGFAEMFLAYGFDLEAIERNSELKIRINPEEAAIITVKELLGL